MSEAKAADEQQPELTYTQAACKLPQLTQVWGSVTCVYADGTAHRFKDAKVYPGRCEAWDWDANVPPTRHQPGIQVADIREVLATDVEFVVLSKGVNGKLECQPSVLEACKAADVEVIHELTPVAVQRFNELAAAHRRVGGVFHSTC